MKYFYFPGGGTIYPFSATLKRNKTKIAGALFITFLFNGYFGIHLLLV